MGGGAWSFLVGGVICLVNSDNERDLTLLSSKTYAAYVAVFFNNLSWRSYAFPLFLIIIINDALTVSALL